MGVLQRFERRLEGMVQGAFARAFGGWVEPVEVAAALTREAEDKKAIVAAGRVLVPNTYVVELGRSDADRLREYDEPLRKELAAMVSEAAQERGWSFVGPVEVEFQETDDLATGAFQVRSAVIAGEAAEPAPEQACLEVGTRSVPITGTVVLGRGLEADVQIPDTGVSRRHAQIDGNRISDLGSTNGTRVNGTRITEAELQDGDRITLGSTEIVFRSGR
ncbi:MAG: FhaA domain-containing protein [Mycobacteriales bacterium]